MSKSSAELALRRHLRLPRHHTANDGATILLRIAALVTIASVLSTVVVPWIFVRFAVFTASSFVGLALQQYAWYTGRIFVECWSEEGFPVVATIVLVSVLLGALSWLFSILLQGVTRFVVLGGLHMAVLCSWRWGSIWGSLFDVRTRLACSPL